MKEDEELDGTRVARLVRLPFFKFLLLLIALTTMSSAVNYYFNDSTMAGGNWYDHGTQGPTSNGFRFCALSNGTIDYVALNISVGATTWYIKTQAGGSVLATGAISNASGLPIGSPSYHISNGTCVNVDADSGGGTYHSSYFWKPGNLAFPYNFTGFNVTMGEWNGGNNTGNIMAVYGIGFTQDAAPISPNMSSCSQNLNVSGTTYTLTANTTTSATCFNITASNIILDCLGHNVSKSGAAVQVYGAHTETVTNVTIRNCIFEGFYAGVFVDATNNSMFQNNTMKNNTNGMWASYGSTNDTFANNTLIQQSGAGSIGIGLYVTGATNQNLTNNTFFNNTITNGAYGVQLTSAADGSSMFNDTFTFNNITNYTTAGFYIAGSNGAVNDTFTNNTLTSTNSTSKGIYILNVGSENNTFLGNIIQAAVWVSDAAPNNKYNNSNMGNIYYLLNGTASWLVYNLWSSNTNTWADNGASRPFNATTVGGNWSGSGADWFPYTTNTTAPSINMTLIAPVNGSSYPASTISLTFSWNCSGPNSTYLANLTINGSLNISDIPCANNSVTSQAVNFARTGAYSWSVMAGNASIIGNSTTSNFSITNFRPNITSLVIVANNTVLPSGPLNYSIKVVDWENATTTVYTSWFKNGVNQTALANTTIVQNNTLTVINATGIPYTGGDNWSVSAFALDGGGNQSVAVTSNTTTIVTVTNIFAYATTPANGDIYPATQLTLDFVFTCNGTYDSFLANITINGTANATTSQIPALNNTPTTKALTVGIGQTMWAVNCYNNSANQTSTANAFSIYDHAPNVTSFSFTANGSAYQLGPMSFNVTYVDWENTTATLYYSVFKNGSNQTAMAGTAVLTNNTLFNVYLDYAGPFNPTDYWNVSVFVGDGGNQSAAIMSNNTTIGSYFSGVTITNTAAASGTSFTDTLAFTLLGAPSSTAYFIFNGSNITGTNGGTLPSFSFNASKVAPFVSDPTNITGNWFYRAILANGSFFETNNTTTITVNPYGVISCGAVSNTSAVIFNFLDAVNGSAINATLSTILYEQVGGNPYGITQIVQTNTTQTYCLTPSNGVLNITETETVSASGYNSQTIFRSYVANNTTQFFNIYMYPIANGYPVQLLVQQYPTIPLANINISIYTFSAPSNYTLLQSCATGSSGTCLVHLIPNTVFYLFNFTYQGVTSSFGPETLVCNPASSLCYRTFTILQTVLPPYIVGGMTGSCVYSNATRTVSCTGTDPSNTITNYSINILDTSNNQLCINSSIGASSAISCALPVANGTYQFNFLGGDVNGNTYSLSYGTIVSGITTPTFGRDGWLAMLFLFVIIALSGVYSPVLSVVLGCVALLGGGLMGIVPFASVQSVAIVLGVLAGFLAYRTRL